MFVSAGDHCAAGTQMPAEARVHEWHQPALNAKNVGHKKANSSNCITASSWEGNKAGDRRWETGWSRALGQIREESPPLRSRFGSSMCEFLWLEQWVRPSAFCSFSDANNFISNFLIQFSLVYTICQHHDRSRLVRPWIAILPHILYFRLVSKAAVWGSTPHLTRTHTKFQNLLHKSDKQPIDRLVHNLTTHFSRRSHDGFGVVVSHWGTVYCRKSCCLSFKQKKIYLFVVVFDWVAYVS